MSPSRQESESESSVASSYDFNDDAELDGQTMSRKKRRLSPEIEDGQDSSSDIPPVSVPVNHGSRIVSRVNAKRMKKVPVEADPVLVAEAADQPKSKVTSSQNDNENLSQSKSHNTFASLNVSPWLVHSLAGMAIRRPTAIQSGCIPEILKGRDCIGGSRTGSGKTVAFAVPILQKWAEDPIGIFALVMTPTRFVPTFLMLSFCN